MVVKDHSICHLCKCACPIFLTRMCSQLVYFMRASLKVVFAVRTLV